MSFKSKLSGKQASITLSLMALSFLSQAQTPKNSGIGTNTPGSKLEIKAATNDASKSALNVTDSDSKSLLFLRNDGNIGISNNTPLYRFDINGTFRSYINPNSSIIYDGNELILNGINGGISGGSCLKFTAIPAQFYNLMRSSGDLGFAADGGYAQMILKNNGNFGIGTSAPSALLHLAGSDANRASLHLSTGVAPATPNDGDIWYDGTNLKFRKGASTVDLTGASGGGALTGTPNQIPYFGADGNVTGNSSLKTTGGALTISGAYPIFQGFGGSFEANYIGVSTDIVVKGNMVFKDGWTTISQDVSSAGPIVYKALGGHRIINNSAGGLSNPLLELNNSGADTQDLFRIVKATVNKFVVASTGNVGIGTTAPSALLHLAGSDANRASLHLSTGVAPATPNDGDIWYDGTNLKFRKGASTVDLTGASGGGGALTGTANQITYFGADGSATSSANLKYDGTLSVKGTDATASNYALKVDNSANTNLLNVRNDGSVYAHGPGGITSNSAFGFNCLISNTLGTHNTAFGVDNLRVNSIGTHNSAFGHSALYNNIGSFNTADGYASLALNTIGERNTANGYGSLGINTTGVKNSAFGMFAGNVNTTGSNNIFIGYGANPSVNNLTNAIAIGYGAIVSQNNTMSLGDNVNVTIGNTSASARLHVKGNDATSTNYALKVENSAGEPILYAKNDKTLWYDSDLIIQKTNNSIYNRVSIGNNTIGNAKNPTAIGGSNTINNDGSTAVGYGNTATGGVGQSVVIGSANTAGDRAVTIGSSSNADVAAIVIGASASAHQNGISIGWYSGKGSYAGGGDGSLSIGYGTNNDNTKPIGNYASAVGTYITSSGNNSGIFGTYGDVTASSSFILGGGSPGTGLRLVNNIPYSIMFGVNSDAPTMIVTGGNGGAGSKGNVGIGTTAPTSKLQVVGILEYADNAAALAAGLTIGAFYRTGDLLKVVH